MPSLEFYWTKQSAARESNQSDEIDMAEAGKEKKYEEGEAKSGNPKQ